MRSGARLGTSSVNACTRPTRSLPASNSALIAISGQSGVSPGAGSKIGVSSASSSVTLSAPTSSSAASMPAWCSAVTISESSSQAIAARASAALLDVGDVFGLHVRLHLVHAAVERARPDLDVRLEAEHDDARRALA